MSLLKFDLRGAARLAGHAANAQSWGDTYIEKGTRPGLWLVADQGVYLMSNGTPGLMDTTHEPPKSAVVYAAGLDPEVDKDDWYDRKVSIIGGDDMVVTLPWCTEVIALYQRHKKETPDQQGMLTLMVDGDRIEMVGA